jgi:hypothetical protein
MKPIKLVFLDFDGVLNSWEFVRSDRYSGETGGRIKLDPLAVSRLNRLVTATGACVVVTSTWRIGKTHTQLCDLLHEVGFEGIVQGMTPHLARDKCRGLEIQQWIDDAPRYNVTVESFVIFDDDSDMFPLMDRLIKTSMDTGLTDEHVERAVEMLNAPTPLLVVPTAEEVSRPR